MKNDEDSEGKISTAATIKILFEQYPELKGYFDPTKITQVRFAELTYDILMRDSRYRIIFPSCEVLKRNIFLFRKDGKFMGQVGCIKKEGVYNKRRWIFFKEKITQSSTQYFSETVLQAIERVEYIISDRVHFIVGLLPDKQANLTHLVLTSLPEGKTVKKIILDEETRAMEMIRKKLSSPF